MRKLIKLSLVAGLLVAGGVVLFSAFSRPKAPQQPIAFNHWQHVTKQDGPQLGCTDCHAYADQSPHATIPNTTTCMLCHESEKTDSPEVQKLAAYVEKNEQPPWRRVIWVEEDGKAFFTHKPHVRAGVDCAECHGQIGQMQEVRREQEPTMGWCINCHKQRNVSNDCYVCHR